MAKRGEPTKYPGVLQRDAVHPATRKPDTAFYVRYRKAGKLIEERLGWRSEGWTPARASSERAARLAGAKPSNVERRDQERAEKAAQDARWTLSRLWAEHKGQKTPSYSLRVDDNRFKRHVVPTLGSKTPDELVTLDADRLRMKLLKTHSAQTAKHVLALLKRVIRFGVKKGLIDPPSPKRFSIEMPQFDNATTETLSDEQLSALLRSAAEDENWKAGALVRLALATGMRKGEMLRLTWADVDFDAGFITLPKTKSGKVQRVPLNGMAREVLVSLPRSAEHIFPGGKEGEHVQNLYPALRRIRARAGLPPATRPLHAWRHVFASRLASSGESLYIVQKLLRHGDGRMTQRYSHLTDKALSDASEKAGAIMELTQGNGGKVVDLVARKAGQE